MNLTSILTRTYTGLLLVGGVALLFAPEVMIASTADSLSSAESAQSAKYSLLYVQLVGAAFLAFAASNWAARGLQVGGIYSRAIVVGNQTFSFISALVLIGSLPNPASFGVWYVLATLVFGAIVYSVLAFRPSWFERSRRTE